MSSPRSEFIAGAKAMLPLVIGAFPFDIIFGALAITAGISIPATIAMSALVFAGSAQFVAIGLFGIGVSVPFIILTTFVVNLRFVLYSATLAPFVKHLPQRWVLLLSHMITDEPFVFAIARYNQPDNSPYKHWYHLGVNLTMFVFWQLATWVGIFAGSRIPDSTRLGLDFILIVIFIGILIPLVKNRPVLAAVVVASVVAVLTFSMPHKIGLIIAALAGVAAGVIAEARLGDSQPVVEEAVPGTNS